MQREKRLEPALQVLRQHGADSASHAPERRAGQAASAAGQARGVLLPAAVQPDRQQLSRTRSWASSRARRKTTCGAASRTGTRATTASSTCRAPIACEPGTGWQIDPGILHAPGSLVTYEPQVNSDVFAMFQSEVEGRIVAVGPADEGRAAGAPPRSRLHRRACSTGTRTSIPSSAQSNRVLPEAGAAVRGNRSRRVSRAVGLLRHAAGTRRRS